LQLANGDRRSTCRRRPTWPTKPRSPTVSRRAVALPTSNAPPLVQCSGAVRRSVGTTLLLTVIGGRPLAVRGGDFDSGYPRPGGGSYSRYYYDAEQGRCLPFDYAGSLGNYNNFVTKLDCELFCSRRTHYLVSIYPKNYFECVLFL
jgi:hypothetical protein